MVDQPAPSLYQSGRIAEEPIVERDEHENSSLSSAVFRFPVRGWRTHHPTSSTRKPDVEEKKTPLCLRGGGISPLQLFVLSGLDISRQERDQIQTIPAGSVRCASSGCALFRCGHVVSSSRSIAPRRDSPAGVFGHTEFGSAQEFDETLNWRGGTTAIGRPSLPPESALCASEAGSGRVAP